jgi:hypothetical protein
MLALFKYTLGLLAGFCRKLYVYKSGVWETMFYGDFFACAAWNIWKARNDFIFNSKPVSFSGWKVCFLSDLLLHKYTVKPCNVQPLVEWLLSILV